VVYLQNHLRWFYQSKHPEDIQTSHLSCTDQYELVFDVSGGGFFSGGYYSRVFATCAGAGEDARSRKT